MHCGSCGVKGTVSTCETCDTSQLVSWLVTEELNTNRGSYVRLSHSLCKKQKQHLSSLSLNIAYSRHICTCLYCHLVLLALIPPLTGPSVVPSGLNVFIAVLDLKVSYCKHPYC